MKLKYLIPLMCIVLSGCATSVRPPYYYHGQLVSCGNPNCMALERQHAKILTALTAIEMYPEQAWQISSKELKAYWKWQDSVQRAAPEVKP